MSVTIIDHPKSFDFRGNGLKYRVKGENYITTETCKAHFVFRKIGVLENNNTFYFAIPDNQSEGLFAWARNPPITPQNYLAISAGVTIEETAIELSNIFDLNKYYKFWVENVNELHCEYISPAGIDFSFVGFVGAAYENIYDDNSLLISGCQGRVVRENYHINAVLNFQNENIATIQADVDSDGFAELEFGKYIPKDVFNIGAIAHSIYRNSVDLKYKVSFSEHYSGFDFTLIPDTIRQVMPGKLAFEKHNDWETYPAFLNILNRQDTFNDAFIKLCYLSDEANVDFYIKYYYTDKTTEQLTLFSDTAENNDLFFLNLKVSDLLSQGNGTKEVYRFDILTIEYFAATSKFYLRQKNYLDKEFAFRNKFGVFETFIATGFKSVEKKTESKTYKRYTPASYDAINGEFTRIVKNSHNEYSVTSGSKTLDEIQQIADALKTELFYERDGSRWVKCELLSDSVSISDEEDFVHSLTFKYRYSSDD